MVGVKEEQAVYQGNQDVPSPLAVDPHVPGRAASVLTALGSTQTDAGEQEGVQRREDIEQAVDHGVVVFF